MATPMGVDTDGDGEATMTMNGVVTQTGPTIEGLEQVLIQGDLAKLSAEDRVRYYARTCESLGLNPLTKPFEYINLSGRLVLYAKRDATDQLRRRYGVSIARLEREALGDVYAVTAYARDREGREDSSIGAVAVAGLKGEALANAMMKAETKAKRRVTLSICGLGMLDETELESIPDARTVPGTPAEAFRARVNEAPAPSPAAVTEKTVDAIVARARKKGLRDDAKDPKEAMTALLVQRYQVETVWELSAGQAQDFYSYLHTLPDAPAPAEAAGGDSGLFQGEMTL